MNVHGHHMSHQKFILRGIDQFYLSLSLTLSLSLSLSLPSLHIIMHMHLTSIIFIEYKGQYIQTLSANGKITLDIVSKLAG